MTKDEISNSLRNFKSRREDLLHEDEAAFEHHLERFVDFCRRDSLVQAVLSPLLEKTGVDVDGWWNQTTQHHGKVSFPPDTDQELALRFRVLEKVSADPNCILQFGIARGATKGDQWLSLFRTMVARPFVEELSHRLGDAADLASPEAREMQAVPLNRIPSPREIKIFLSHKSVDKPLVYRYYHALKEAGFSPWLDEPNMAAGANLEREVLRGFEESCAAVFLITVDFRDENYLATEVEYALIQKRKKGKKFAIITLRYSDAAPVPGLLKPFVYKDVGNDLEGFYEILRALPIELGPVRWKADVVE